jgi:hypothetical protein
VWTTLRSDLYTGGIYVNKSDNSINEDEIAKQKDSEFSHFARYYSDYHQIKEGGICGTYNTHWGK